MEPERLPDSDIEEALRLLLRRGHKLAVVLLSEVEAVHVLQGADPTSVRLELSFEEFVAEDLTPALRQQIADALGEVLAATGRTVTGIAVKTVHVEPLRWVPADMRPWRQRVVDQIRAHGQDPRKPFVRGHVTRVVEIGEGAMSVSARCSCGWSGGRGESIDLALDAARRHSTHTPEVLRSDEAMAMLVRSLGIDPQE